MKFKKKEKKGNLLFSYCTRPFVICKSRVKLIALTPFSSTPVEYYHYDNEDDEYDYINKGTRRRSAENKYPSTFLRRCIPKKKGNKMKYKRKIEDCRYT